MTTTDWLASQHLRNLYQATRNVARKPLVRQTESECEYECGVCA